MQPISNQLYATWKNEIGISVDKTSHINETREAMKEAMLEIAKAKTGLAQVTLAIAWNISGNCYSETITG